MAPVFDPDATREDPLPLDLMDAIIIGFGRCRSAAFLKEYAERWAEEVKASPRRGEVREAYRKWMEALK